VLDGEGGEGHADVADEDVGAEFKRDAVGVTPVRES
jgi:hypothetical protein